MKTENPVEEPLDALYDFLYRDANRLLSYYAQIFEGNLVSFEELETQTDTAERELKGDIKVASTSAKTVDAKQAQTRRIFDPHDQRNSDVLNFLQDNQFIYADYMHAPSGSLILVKGVLFFADKNILAAAIEAVGILAENPLTEMSDDQRIGIKILPNMISGGLFQPVCFLQTERNHLITGTVKEFGLEEPISTYTLKYGSAGLNDVYIIGVKETPAYLEEVDLPLVTTSTEELNDNLSNFMCGEESIRITPLVIYRKIEPVKKQKIVLASAARPKSK